MNNKHTSSLKLLSHRWRPSSQHQLHNNHHDTSSEGLKEADVHSVQVEDRGEIALCKHFKERS